MGSAEFSSEATSPSSDTTRPASLTDAIIPLVALVLSVAAALSLFGPVKALDGPVQVGLLLCCAIAALIAMKNGHKWSVVEEVSEGAMSSISGAIFILLAVGALIGAWNLSGTIPTVVYYGIQILSPDYYYLATVLLCGGLSLAIGRSWTVAGTIGVGLVGIAPMLGVSPVITAGAVISGSYLGDKLSPLSEMTVISAQIAKIPVYTHIRSQSWTTVPAFLVAVAVYAVLGFAWPAGRDKVPEGIELAKLDQVFWISPWNLLPLVLLVYLSIRRAPAYLALLGSALFACVQATILQRDVVNDFVRHIHGSSNYLAGSIQAVWKVMANGFLSHTGITDIDYLLDRGGMDSMLMTIWLIIGCVSFGALLERFGLIDRLINPLIDAAKTTGRLFLSVLASGVSLNLFAGDQIIAVVLPGRMFRAEFARRGFAPQVLSRLAADSGTPTSALVPWNSCGAFMSAVLGVSTLAYLPFAVFNYLAPVLSVVYGVVGFKIVTMVPAVESEDTEEETAV